VIRRVSVVPFFDLKRQYQALERELLSATERVYARGQFILGEEVSAFEKEFADYCGVRYGVGVGSGTDALTLALRAAGIGKGDEVVTVANSFIATALAISFAGAKPVFVDIDPETHTMDPNALEHLLKRRMGKGRSRKIKAILPVHLYGHPCSMSAIMEIAHRHRLWVIEDAAQAHGAEYDTRKVGSFGAMGCFSFYPTKNLGAYGDGGMVVTDKKKIYENLRLLRCYGEKSKYHHISKGMNSRLDELQAALLRVKLKYLDPWNEARREKARAYTALLESAPILKPYEKEPAHHVYHLYVIRTKHRNSLQKFLKERGIGTLIHYPIPIHLQKAYRDLGHRKGHLPFTEQLSQEVLSLPFFPEMEDSEMEGVAEGVRSFFDQPGRPSQQTGRNQRKRS
jgi:dTDP-4-amino-4,6-dideoxygalactose transaminase